MARCRCCAELRHHRVATSYHRAAGLHPREVEDEGGVHGIFGTAGIRTGRAAAGLDTALRDMAPEEEGRVLWGRRGRRREQQQQRC
mmetsp:Transcript_19594/g.22427  ORF Transcript_19594/g.22427 Transcript_19594/m.22427 type:complete len:86 (-) Transcript_19594:1236-1493(-)